MRLLIWLIAAVLTLGAHSHAHARWLKAETQNFVIYSEGSEKSLRTFAENLQRFDATLRSRFKLSDAPDPNRLPIFLVERAEDAGRLATGKGGSSIAGFYAPAPDGSFAVSNRESYGSQGTSDAQQVLFHEYAHHFMHRYVRAAFPAWFVEGFAEYYSTVDFTKDQRAEIGKPVFRRAYGLLEMPKVPAKDLLFKRPGEMRNSGEMDTYYGRAWLMTHMLFNSTGRSGQLSAYITAINNGSDSKQAATDKFGDLELLDKDLNKYLTRPLNYITTGQPIALSGTVTITPLSPAEDAVLPWRLERMSSDSDQQLVKVRDALVKLSATYADDAVLWFELAIANWRMSKDKRDVTAARTAVDKALAIDPNHVRANVLLGQIIAADLDAKGDYSAASWRKVRASISLANRTNPDDPLPLYAYFQSFVDQGVNPPDIAIQGLARAFNLAPENIMVRVSHAFALANKGEFDEAIKLGQTVAFNPHDNGEGQRLLNQLERMRDRAEGKEAGDDVTESEKTSTTGS
jgi:tetratricopeptide (TPR) repeat protein